MIDIDPQKSKFIDFGCGKGRTLIMAALRNIKEVIGVEFAEELCVCANNNISKTVKEIPEINIQVINKDATKFEIPSDANILFFNNPFNNHVLNKVIKNIEDSISIYNRPIYIIYMTPFYQHLFEESNFRKTYELKWKNKIEAVIYKQDEPTIANKKKKPIMG
jgi:predicted RNA methylase